MEQKEVQLPTADALLRTITNTVPSYTVLPALQQSKQQMIANPPMGLDPVYYRRLSYLRRQVLYHFIRSVIRAPLWLIRLVHPNFRRGGHDIWDNLRAILRRDEFGPLRSALLAWMIVVLLFIIILALNIVAIKAGYL